MNIVSTILAGLMAAVGFIIVIALLALLFAWPVMALWNNCAVPAVSGLHPIGWVQALGLMILCGFLFRSTSTSTKS